MTEKNLDFDKIINRRNTKSLKYDFIKQKGMPENIIPLWVADMDFKTSSYIQEALHNQIEHGIYGYSETLDDYFDIVKEWMKKQYNWNVSENWLIKTPGIVFALAMAVKAFTKINDGILIQLPVYYPFSEVIKSNKRRVISNDLIYGEDNKYHIDFDDFENKIINENIKLFFLCNPHNPVSRVWTREELIRLGDICLKHNVIVVSDEIHADFTFIGKHNVFCNLKKEYENISITCTSPSKTFNLAGLQVSNIFIQNHDIKEAFKKQIYKSGYSQLNIMGIIACEAAYKYGAKWYKSMYKYVCENIQFAKMYIKDNIPQITMVEHEGTYLIWLDFRRLKLTDEQLDNIIINKAGLWLDSGRIFGKCGSGFQRINVACPRSILKEALNRIKNIL